MEFKYIFAIAVLGIFLLLIFISFALLERGRIRGEKLQSWIMEQFNSANVKNYEYDADDEEISEQTTEAVVEKEDIEEESSPEVQLDDPYGKIDIEGIEEITGNYNGDK